MSLPWYINADIVPGQKTRSGIGIIQNAQLTYLDFKIPNPEEFVSNIGKVFNPKRIDFAIRFFTKEAQNKLSTRSLLEQVIRIRLLTWEQIESFVHKRALQVLEQLLPYCGTIRFDPTIKFDLSYGKDGHGLNWFKLTDELRDRQQQWTKLAPIIPSMDAIPYLAEDALSKIMGQELRRQLIESVDGKHSLVEIAENKSQDSLMMARAFLKWIELGWVVFNSPDTVAPKSDLPIILAVDDSPTIQMSIKCALAQEYQVLTASSVAEAMKILAQKNVALVVSDVDMPEISGLEMCRMMRGLSKFRNLPIILLTGRDGFADRMRGQIAGSNKYLTKPFEREHLRETVRQFLTS